ncbi:MAG: hypothetical protein E5Y88_15555 [Mesorhizobium sp.]|uniref:Lipoprotein n=1 Tax=Mesorhizobium mediterraneum TaxID=43617 RepID=A0AB36R8H3_9HYPH|nr:hypothetical protein EJ075_27880 [Mesorhizobium sp. M6A.T.Cr.TU.016.01.1.1]PAQ01226.1 hypothetical protein CIT25_14130 [Mesorhizobium mediterraneum]RUU29025.1 hypothetical protein EOC94_16405 [Mesorhizobium sp. M6A.T.Ce.TU.016.01.1.1]RUU43926.1 hypothetical protein EOC93_12940 [Mesorhizobium sp. M6A.T.Ce.TU.002.03.1.1]RUU48593.1 hypothetical protein EOD08_01885 [Mesorhizobium sp. M6A.T.Ca.TU.002.02.2.1]RUU96982.1 hypothetical protein EOB36_28385 [Mesorhizobium sp. M6A.T.Cr.TU.017.01.1.1]RV
MKIASSAMLASLLVTGCAATTPPDILPAFNPADPAMGVRDVHYHPVVVDYRHREPVDPRNWRRLNQERSPVNPGAGS